MSYRTTYIGRLIGTENERRNETRLETVVQPLNGSGKNEITS